MPWYNGYIPTAWKNAVERKAGAIFNVEIVIDPNGLNYTVPAKYDVVSISPISVEKDLHPKYFVRPTVKTVSLIFNDPDNQFDPDNSSSTFSGYAFPGKDIVINLVNRTETTINRIAVFTGKIDKKPALFN